MMDSLVWSYFETPKDALHPTRPPRVHACLPTITFGRCHLLYIYTCYIRGETALALRRGRRYDRLVAQANDDRQHLRTKCAQLRRGGACNGRLWQYAERERRCELNRPSCSACLDVTIVDIYSWVYSSIARRPRLGVRTYELRP